MKKQSLSLILTFCIIFGIFFCASAYAQESIELGRQITGTLDSTGTLTISGNGNTRFTSLNSPLLEYEDDIKNVIIEEDVETICSGLFKNLYNLESIKIPSSIYRISADAFAGCSSLVNIEVAENNADFCVYNGDLYTKDKTVLITYAKGKADTSFTVPDTVTVIENSSFWGAKNLTEITVPDTVTIIGTDAFRGTAWLKNQPVGLVYIGSFLYGFNGTDSECPECIEIKGGTKRIADSAFFNLENLKTVIIPDSVVYIGESAFKKCSSLSNITIPDNVEIGNEAFWGISFENFPKGVVYIGKCVYGYNGEIPENGEIVIADGTEKIENDVFGNLHFNSIYIPKSVTKIGSYAFEECDELEHIYYAGSEYEFESIYENVWGISAEITYDYKEPKISVIKTTDENKNVTAVSVTPFCVPDKSAVMLAGFFGNRLSDLQFLPKADGVLNFNITKQADNFEVFVWDGLGTMKPITEK